MLLTRSPLEYPASWAFPFDLHVLSTPPAFVLSQDQTLHENLAKQPTHKRAGVSTLEDQERKPDQSKKPAHATQTGPDDMNKKIHHNIHKECSMPKTASDNSSSHYRVLKEHTPTRYSPHHRAFTSRLGSDLQTLTPSPGQLFQPTRPDPHPANPWICTVRKSGNPNPPSRNTTGLEPEDQGRSARTRSPLPEPNPHRALRGRRRGALTVNKLRR